MEYQNLVRDFAIRTMRNLEAVEAATTRDRDAELYEVTQLINSMLGLLVFPQQKYCSKIPEKSLEELRASGWPVPTMTGTPPNADNLRDLVPHFPHIRIMISWSFPGGFVGLVTGHGQRRRWHSAGE